MEKVSKTLTAHLTRISELVTRIETSGASHIDVDMLLATLRDMYDAVYSIEVGKAVEEPQPKPVEKTEHQVIVEPEPQVVEEPQPKEEVSPLFADTESKPVYAEEQEAEQTAAQVAEQPTMEEIEGEPNATLFDDNVTAAEEPAEEVAAKPVEKPAPEPEPEKAQQPSLFEYLKKGEAEQPAARTIADDLGKNNSGGIEQKINANKVADLRTVININDKFSFMNELFHNNMKGYNDFIMRLNAIGSRQEALAYVSEVAEQYKWENESMTVKAFYKVFDRKF